MKNILFVGFLITSITVFGQHHDCQTVMDEHSMHQLETFSNFYYHQNGQYLKDEPTLKILPITFHIVRDDNGSQGYTINRAFRLLCELNELMDTAKLFFSLNDIRFINNSQWNADATSNYTNFSLQKVDNSINVFLVGNTPTSELCGVYVGTAVDQGNAGGRDIILMSETCINAPTLAHEIGHFLSLPHTFNEWEGRGTAGNTGNAPDWAERVDGSNCSTSGDKICDTPPDYLYIRWSGNNCEASGTLGFTLEDGTASIELTDPDGVSFTVDGTNTMSYSSDECLTHFTHDQIEAMHFNIENFRSELIQNTTIATIDENPNLTSPLPTDTVPFDIVLLEWEAVPNATHYLVQVNFLPTFPQTLMIAEELTTETSIEIFDVEPNRTLRWRVIPYSPTNTCEIAPSQSFLVGEFSVDAAEYAIEDIRRVTVFPNPTYPNRKTQLKIYASDNLATDVFIYSINGQVIQNQPLNLFRGNNFIELDTAKFESGVYIINIQQGEKRITERLIVFE